ncbi:MAG: RND efflux system, inner membrane transporter [uncultured Lysobacter sp.]|uniref:RND efflux system, inner membrane transporter n=1 Tax=uncultured Lysobacter sp. TaxID=271060 RepID=A0A6J4M101_9GAMM|nr:MAG: RND efflux system, inner membrane transporter [uncultured Lysobacter sp.]
MSNTKLATLGVPVAAVQQALNEQNAILPAGFFETASSRVALRVDGRFDSVEEIRAFPIRVGDRTFRLGDLADIRRGFSDPAAPRMRFMGEDAIGIGVAMKDGGDILRLGKRLEAEFATLQRTLPAGMELRKVSDQPAAVEESVGEFIKVLTEAVVIVLLVSFFSLGVRTGLVVALSIPLVLAMTFAMMDFFGVGLHKISLGALVLALGLLVDDAIIAVEMMAIKMEQGYSRLRAAAFAWESTAFPMLTGTLITAAGFLPIATAQSSTGEYTRSLFEVVTIALLVSWVAAVAFIPYLGDKLLPDHGHAAKLKPGSVAARWHARRQQWAARYPRYADFIAPPPHDGKDHDPYATRFYTRFRGWVAWCVRRRKTVMAITAAAFVASVLMFRFVPQQFFPDSVRPELMVDMELAEGSSLRATQAQAERLEAMLRTRRDLVNFVAYVGTGSPRFYLPLDQQLPAANFAQFVLMPKDVEAREAIRRWIIEDVSQRFPELQMRVTRLENGPPVGYPVQFRVSGEHLDEVRRIAHEVRAKVAANPHVVNVNLDWDEPSKVVRLEIDQARARALGVSSAQLSQVLAGSLSGAPISTYREGDELIEVMLRGDERERLDLDGLASLMVPTSNGASVPLSQIATLDYGFEDGIVWHRDGRATMTVRADIYDGTQPPTVSAQISPTLDAMRAALPHGYSIEVGGTVEDSARGQNSIAAGMPLFVFVVFTLLMLQLRSFSHSVMVMLTAPLGLIGVTLFLLVFRVPFGFVAMLGTIALAGMIMRNSVILVDQIEHDRAEGAEPAQAIVEATVRRFRPIVLTALAAILAMIPLSRSAFFGPMAVAIMGGLLVATVLTLFFLPALYAGWFRVKAPANA